MKHLTGFLLSTRSIGSGLFDADDFMALRALAEAMTGGIHFVPWSKPTRIGCIPDGHNIDINLSDSSGFLCHRDERTNRSSPQDPCENTASIAERIVLSMDHGVLLTPRCRNDLFKTGGGSTTRNGKNATEIAAARSPNARPRKPRLGRPGLFIFLLTRAPSWGKIRPYRLFESRLP
jgi:hypothetical protein